MKEKIKVFGIIYRDDTLNHCGEMWVFGKDVKGQEVYIKITLGKGASALCISFHIAEHPMNYPFK